VSKTGPRRSNLGFVDARSSSREYGSHGSRGPRKRNPCCPDMLADCTGHTNANQRRGLTRRMILASRVLHWPATLAYNYMTLTEIRGGDLPRKNTATGCSPTLPSIPPGPYSDQHKKELKHRGIIPEGVGVPRLWLS